MSGQRRIPADELVRRLRTGDSEAARQLFDRYVHQLVLLAQRHLSDQLAGRLDGEDIVQSALRSFFSREARGEFQIDSSAQLCRLLVKMTINKARAKARHHTARRRSVSSEAPIGDELLAETISREPSPDEVASMIDQVDTVLRGLPDLYGSILRKRLEGHSVGEIARELAVSRQTVYRALDLLRRRILSAG